LQGEQGLQGEEGPPGPSGTAATIVRAKTGTVEDNTAVVQCNDGERALSGGVTGEPDAPAEDLSIELSVPVKADGTVAGPGDHPTGWMARAEVLNHPSGTERFTVFVICTTP
jgi:hypothetical protein